MFFPGPRRRGRSRNCCGEDLQSFQALHALSRGGTRQSSPPDSGQGHGQDPPLVDYRRLVFISSDSSSGREEDDADSSCSGSSYLNGLPRQHAQSLEDCDWDYFESGSLPLPAGVGLPLSINASNNAADATNTQDWSCCPGRGACQVIINLGVIIGIKLCHSSIIIVIWTRFSLIRATLVELMAFC